VQITRKSGLFSERMYNTKKKNYQITYWLSSYRSHRLAGRKAKYGRFSVLPRPEIYRNLRIKDSVKIDPTCGSAGMLISCIAHLKARGQEWRNVHVYGQEINALTSAIGRMNLFLHGVEDFHIVNDDTLKNPAFIPC